MKSASELRNILVDSGKYSTEDANNIKGKKNLLDRVEELDSYDPNDNLDFDLNNATAEIMDLIVNEQNQLEKEEEEEEEKLNNNPQYHSIEWPDFVMSQFTEDELINGLPKLHGLRRVVEYLLGEVIVTHPVKTGFAEEWAICDYEVHIAWRLGSEEYMDLNRDWPTRVFGSSCSASLENTPFPFNKHLLSTCESKAEAKALRKALRLNVVAAEEIDKMEEEEEDNGMIQPHQAGLINTLSARLGVDLEKLFEYNAWEFDLSNCTREDGALVITKLNQYQNTSKQGIAIPEEVKNGSK